MVLVTKNYGIAEQNHSFCEYSVGSNAIMTRLDGYYEHMGTGARLCRFVRRRTFLHIFSPKKAFAIGVLMIFRAWMVDNVP